MSAPDPLPEGAVAVIFTSQRSGDDEGYAAMAERMMTLVEAQDGYLGATSVRDPATGVGITVSYWRDEAAANIVIATKGYPDAYEKGSEIRNLDEAGAPDAVEIFHAGTKADGDRLLANGGRVLNVTATGADVGEALDNAYAAIEKIDWPEGFYRTDIGKHLRG